MVSSLSPMGTPLRPKSSLILVLATGAGLAVACLYYSQPLLGVLATDLHESAVRVGWVPTLTQLGYALGILFLNPLGDRFDRRKIILLKAFFLVLALLGAACADSLESLWVASLCIGVTATLAQDIVPAAATLAPESERGKIVGFVMTGLLLGILLSRVVSGLVAESFGWRAMFLVAALLVSALAWVIWLRLPRFTPTSEASYGAILVSLFDLVKKYPLLRQAAWTQGLLSMAFSAFWSNLAVMLHAKPFYLGSAIAGSFGLAGAAGALAAPIAGHLADRHGPLYVVRIGAGLTAAFFALMCLGTCLPPVYQLACIVLGAIGFDLGVQMSLIANQTTVYSIDPSARSRLNSVLFVGMFLGMSTGAALGSLLLAKGGWFALTAGGMLVACLAFGISKKAN